MYITVKSFNGNLINDGTNYETAGLAMRTPPSATLSWINQASSDPVDAGFFTGNVRNVPLAIRIKNYANRWSLDKQLQVWLKRGQRGMLVGTFSDDGLDYQLDCRVQSMVLSPDGGQVVFNITLSSGWSSWKAVVPQTQAWTATDGNLTQALTVNGAEETRLCATLTPSAIGATGWQYQYLYQLVNAPGINYGLNYPWCINLNTATLVSGGKMQASCADLRIIVNGVEVNRWIANPNTASTNVWFNLPLSQGYALTLKNAVPSSGNVGELDFDPKKKDNLTALKTMPSSGILIGGSEWFQYSGIDLKNCKVGVVARGALGTAQAAHNVGDTFNYIQNVIYLITGNSAAADPATLDASYNTNKPVFDLGQSSNSQWVYSASSQFYDPTNPQRPGSWTPSIDAKGNLSQFYAFSQNAESGTPAMGALIANWQNGATWQKESAKIAWLLNCPGGFTQVSATGSKYRNTTQWPQTASLQRSKDGNTWLVVWSETSPVSVSTWTAINWASQAITNNLVNIEFYFGNSLGSAAGAVCYFEILTATVVFVSGNLPQGTMLGQSLNYPMNIRLTNNTNGDFVTFSLPMLTGKSLVMDAEGFTLVVDGVNCHGAMALNDNSRDIWIRLEPGANTLAIAPINAGDSIGTIGLALSWYPRQP